jgi:hypothetical protein
MRGNAGIAHGIDANCVVTIVLRTQTGFEHGEVAENVIIGPDEIGSGPFYGAVIDLNVGAEIKVFALGLPHGEAIVVHRKGDKD